MTDRFPQMDKQFAEGVREARQHAALSQEQVAEKMRELGFEMSQPVVGKIERGERKVTVGEAMALAEVLGVNVLSLVRGESVLRADKLLSRLRALRLETKQALRRYWSAQELVAWLYSDVAKDVPALIGESLERDVLEPLEDIVTETKRDIQAESESRRLRDAMDREGDEVDPARVGIFVGITEGLLGERLKRFGGGLPLDRDVVARIRPRKEVDPDGID
jgi:transcriptional regulator with XRE-family HTH domain